VIDIDRTASKRVPTFLPPNNPEMRARGANHPLYAMILNGSRDPFARSTTTKWQDQIAAKR
jgi:hypothetical protein